MSTTGVAGRVLPTAEKIAAELALEIWDIEYKKEGADYYLRVFIDREGGVDLDACEAFSRRFSDALDELNPIADAYILEVSSAGLDRELKRPADFERFLGSTAEVHTFAAIDGSKQFVGTLAAYRDGEIVLQEGETERVFPKDSWSCCRLYPEF